MRWRFQLPSHHGSTDRRGVYRPSFLAAATDVLDAGGRSIITALHRVDTRLVTESEWRTWNEDGRSWFSVDSQERLEKGQQTYE